MPDGVNVVATALAWFVVAVAGIAASATEESFCGVQTSMLS
jgi:hypothetical protein